MPRIFVRQHVGQVEATNQPIFPPDDPHPTRGRWINNGLDAYRAVFGDAEYEKLVNPSAEHIHEILLDTSPP